ARQIAAVGVRVHLHRAADCAWDVDAELEPRQALVGGEGGGLRQPRAAAAAQPLASALDRGEVAAELEYQSAKSVIGYQQVRARADHSYVELLRVGPGEQLGEALGALRAGEPVGRAAGADR